MNIRPKEGHPIVISLCLLIFAARPMTAAGLHSDGRPEARPIAVRKGLRVTPDGGTASAPGYRSGTRNFVDFRAKVVLESGGTYDVTCSVSGVVRGCTPQSNQVSVYPEPEPYDGVLVRVYFDTGAPGSGRVDVQLTETGCGGFFCDGDSGYYDVNVGDPLPPTLAVRGNDRLLLPQNAYSAEAGPQARFRPQELAVRHELPSYWTMDVERAVTLIYSSQSAAAELVLPFDVTLNADPPDQLSARLEVAGVQQGQHDIL